MIISEKIKLEIKEIIKSLYQIDVEKIPLDFYKGSNFGDFSTSIAFELSKRVGKNPHNLADILIEEIVKKSDCEFEKIENVNGFINLYLSSQYLLKYIKDMVNNDIYGKGDLYKGKKVLVEYTDPNPFKLFHIGHFMTNALGESCSRIIKNQGAEVYNLCYQGDVGIHIAKTIYGLLQFINSGKYTIDEFLNFSNSDTIKEVGDAYVVGSQKYNNSEESKENIQDLNNLIFTISQKLALEQGIEKHNTYKPSLFFQKDIIEKIYDKGRKESLIYFENIYSKLGTKFDELFFESSTAEIGSKVVSESNLFEKSEGAIIWDGKKYDNHNVQVLINKFGIPTYGAKEIGLNLLKKQKYNPDLSLIFTAREQEFYFKDLIKIFDLLKFGQKTMHFPHGELRLKTGKMSSRTGEVITLEEIIDQISKHIVINFSSKKDTNFLELVSEKIAIGSLKYLILKNSIGNNIIYEPDKVTDLNGNTGSYLQYTYARTQSLLKKGGIISIENSDSIELDSTEKELLIKLSQLPDYAYKSAEELSPSTMATYTYEVAKTFNFFYNDHKILDENEVLKNKRLILTFFTSKCLERGLNLLGIPLLEEI